VLALRDLMKVPDIEAHIAVAVEAEHALHFGQRRAPW